MSQKPELTIPILLDEAKAFCQEESQVDNSGLFGVTDGKTIGTYIEHKFQARLDTYVYMRGSSAKGIDLPSEKINTDIKVTSIRHPQSSCPYRNPQQKIYGLGYNVLLFVYDKVDHLSTETSRLDFVNCTFIDQHRTGDYMMSKMLRAMVEEGGNEEEIIGFLIDRNLPADDITMKQLAERIIDSPPIQGYLTISNALQWRLQYRRVLTLVEEISGIVQVIQ